jgi:hypothetical protein
MADGDIPLQHVGCYVKKAAIFNFSLARARASRGSVKKDEEKR